MNRGSSKVLQIVVLALLGTISFALFFLKFPLPLLPPFLKIDFGDIPAIIAGLIFSPVASVVVIGIKNFLYLAIGTGEPIGVSSNFIASSLFVLPIAIFYHKHKSIKSIIAGIGIGTIVMAIVMSLLNYVVFLPLYALFMNVEDYAVESVRRGIVLVGILPFNIIKGIIVGTLFIPVFVKMSSWIENKRTSLA